MTKINPHMLIELRTNPHYFLLISHSIPASEINRMLPRYLLIPGELERLAYGWDYPGDHILHIGDNRTMTRAQWLDYYHKYRRFNYDMWIDSQERRLAK